MDKIIEALYHLQVKAKDVPFGTANKKNLKEEGELYEYLYDKLSKEDKPIFFRYVYLCDLRRNEVMQEAYEYGFKDAIKLFIETLDK